MPWRTFRERWSRLDVARQRRAKTELLCMGVLIFFAGKSLYAFVTSDLCSGLYGN